MNSFCKFNRIYSQHSSNRSKIVTALSEFSNYEPDQFAIENVVDNVSLGEFFRILNEILLTDQRKTDYHWIVFEVIDIAAKNHETRRYLVDTVHILTGLANFAVQAATYLIEEKQILVWTLIDQITVDMNAVTEEPHLSDLICHIVTTIKNNDMHLQRIKLLQLSTLMNLCFKNDKIIACVLRFTKSREILTAVQDIPVFWCKMAMALARFDGTMVECELVTYLKIIFDAKYISKLIRLNDERLLRNVVELLIVGSDRDEHTKQIIQQFDFKECIDGVFTSIDNSKINLQCPQLMSLFLGIVNAILSVSNKSLESNVPRLFQMVNKATTLSSEAIKAIRLFASIVDVTDSADLVSLIVRIIENIHRNDVSVAAETYHLLIEFHSKHPSIIDQLPNNKVIESIATDSWPFKLNESNLSLQIYRLHWLTICENNVANGQLDDIMKMKDVHQILASGVKSSNKEICALTMRLVRSTHFPLDEVCSLLSGTFMPNLTRESQSNCNCQCKSPVEIVRPCFSAALEARVNGEIDRMKLKLETSTIEINDYVTMLEYQSIIAGTKERNLQQQINSQSEMNTLQSNQIGLLQLAIRNDAKKISELESKLENARMMKANMQTTFDSMTTKYLNNSTKINDLTKMNEALDNENVELKQSMKKKNAEVAALLESERDAHAAQLLQLKKENEREKSELMAQHTDEFERRETELTKKFKRKASEVEASHRQDLQKYSDKNSEMEKVHAKEMDDKNKKIAHLENEVKRMEEAEKARMEQILMICGPNVNK